VTGQKRVLLAKPRGYCAGVDRAVQTVQEALRLYGAPIYVRKEIVHNKHVVSTLREQGAIFVAENDEVPEGAIVIFSAHGVAPEVYQQARERGLRAIDATCPLVTKVHQEARRFAAEDYDILLIGHEGHEEVVGTAGEAPSHVQLVDGPDAVDRVTVRDPNKVVWLSQTTLSVDETMQTVDRLRARLPMLQNPPSDDICYATSNRQAAVKQMAPHCDLVLVIGSRNSSNSNRLVEVARELGAEAHLIDNESQVREEWLEGKRVVGISSGASAPEALVHRLVEFFRARGTRDVSELEVLREDVRFMLPKTIRQALTAREESAATA
jgi:4-hydroxy-3-methylbut-2-enyl diphosphate reductase